jgi:hypothetical protein
VPQTLEELRRRGKKIAVVTNGKKVIQQGTIDALSAESPDRRGPDIRRRGGEEA